MTGTSMETGLQRLLRFLATALVLLLLTGACTSIDSDGTQTPPESTSVTGEPEEVQPSVSEAGQTEPDTPQIGNAPIDPEVRAIVVEAIVDFANAVTGADHAEAQGQIVEYLLSRPEFVDAGISEDEIVWGEFTDGTLFVHIDNIYEQPQDEVTGSRPPGVTASLPAAGGGGVPAFAVQSAAGSVIPSSLDVTILEAYGPLDAGVGDLVGPWLQDAGYAVSTSEAGLDELLAAGASGVFLYNGHGGAVKTHFVLSSITPVTPEGNYDYAEQLASGEVVAASVGWEINRSFDPNDVECLVAWAFGQAKPAICKPLTYKSVYAVTEKVVADWEFADGALVVLNACSSKALSDTVTASGSLGAFVGWTTPVAIGGAPKVLGLLFDRLLGINTTPPDERPDLRPFDVKSVFEYMEGKGLTVDPLHKDARLHVVDLGPTILIPSIKVMEVHEDTNELFIEGLFGTRQPIVTIGSTEQDPSNWGAETVVVKIEDTGPTAAGEVTVVVDGRKSNPVPLTEWRGQMFYSADIDGLAKGLEADVTFDLHLRADVHMFRETPDDEPIEREVAISAVGDSKGPWEVHGKASDKGVTFTLTGNGVLDLEENQEDHEGALFAIYGTLVAGAPEKPPTIEDLRIHAHFSSDSEAVLKIEGPGAPTIENGFPLPQSSILSGVTIEFQDNYTIEPDQIEGQSMGIAGPVILYWSEIPATSAPSNDNPPQAAMPSMTASLGWLTD